MTRVDTSQLVETVRRELNIDEYADSLNGAWLIGSMVRDDVFINEGSDVDVLLAFTEEASMDIGYDEYDPTTVPVRFSNGGMAGDGQHPLDVRFERGDISPSGPAISLLEN